MSENQQINLNNSTEAVANAINITRNVLESSICSPLQIQNPSIIFY